MTTAGPDEWLTPAKAAPRAGIHVITMRRLLESGEMHGHQRVKGGRWRVHPDAVDAWVRGTSGETACGCVRLRVAKRAG